MNATTPPLNGLKYLGVAAAGAVDGDALTRRHPMRGHRCWYLNLGFFRPVLLANGSWLGQIIDGDRRCEVYGYSGKDSFKRDRKWEMVSRRGDGAFDFSSVPSFVQLGIQEFFY